MKQEYAVAFTNSKRPVIYCTGCNKQLRYDNQVYLIGRNHWNCESCFNDYKQVMKDQNGIEIIVMKSNFIYESELDPMYQKAEGNK
jgi:hypothetical protein